VLCLGLADSSLLTLFMGSDRDRPLTVDADTLTCDAVRSVVSTDDDGDRCADNGTARTHTPWPDIDAVWADPGQPDLNVDIGDLIDAGLAPCR
jgi:hypothetical protein